jgi:small-conductance mechanosensitive channel
MTQWINWLSANWSLIVMPILVFLAVLAIGLWLRILLYRFFEHWPGWQKWRGNKAVADSIRRTFLDWFLLLGAFVATQSSALSPGNKSLAGSIIASLFIVSLAWVTINIGEKLLRLYTSGVRASTTRSITIGINVVRVTVIIIAVLIILSIWGAPVNPILLFLAVILFVAGLALRDAIPSYLSGMQISSGRQIKVGDFIKLDSGESGQVTSMTWQNTEIKSIQGDDIIIPNNKLTRATVINYGHPLKKATDPFHFSTRLHLRELTGLKARNITELISILKEMPDSVVYYHVHRFLEEHLYLTPEPANDFAIWVNNTLGNDILGEQLASIDTFAFPNIPSVKQRLIDTLEDYLRNYPDSRVAQEEEEFHFIRSISFILPTTYVAHDLREFVEILRKVTIDSIYFHIYEARLRLQKGTNDFSIWISDSLGEKELADKIAGIDPYVYTLENLRSRIIEQIESYIR